ncbi:hypothetical protein GCM10009416_14480 [Craurococcus roseus]|uniref:Uncharacterized protein n=1 Tax=Craurococcus roseus TaxID=77585 RepID=A0ABN1EXE4_9PROT
MIIGKQTQFYTLWGVYTAVQFAAGSFGSGHKVVPGAALAVLLGVWAFNLGHLGFLLQCLKQINELRAALCHGLDQNDQQYGSKLKVALNDLQQGDFFWRFYRLRDGRGGYVMNSAVHFFIDACASLALIRRMGNPAPGVGTDFF